jgi:AraC-like DNA-binding protein
LNKHTYSVLFDYLTEISSDYGFSLCINDFSGFIYSNPELTELLQPFMIHSNPYCMMIKSDKTLWNKCICMKKPIAEKCRLNKGIYYGMCYAGVEEYIIPLFHNGQLIGTLNAGAFRSHTATAERLIKRISRSSSLDESLLLDLYESSLNTNVPNMEKVSNLLGIAAELITRIFHDFSLSHPELINRNRFSSNEDNTLSHILEYIKRNYKDEVYVSDIARFCHCSDSYINHIFKKNMKVNIRRYTNQLRIEDAKAYLIGTDMPIKAISSKVGFNDSNYFCKVFTDICSSSPTQFRKDNLEKGYTK